VQQRWWNRSADHNAVETIGEDCSKTLAVARCALLVIGRAARGHVDAGQEAHPHEGHRVDRSAEGKLKLQLFGQWDKDWIVRHIKIWDETDDALLLLDLDLLQSNLLGKDGPDRGFDVGDRNLNVTEIDLFAGLQDDCRRRPIRKILGADAEVIGDRSTKVSVFKKTILTTR
jgi:hypothetical protein